MVRLEHERRGEKCVTTCLGAAQTRRRGVKGGACRRQFKCEQAQGPDVNGLQIIVPVEQFRGRVLECLQARVHHSTAYDHHRLQVRGHVRVLVVQGGEARAEFSYSWLWLNRQLQELNYTNNII